MSETKTYQGLEAEQKQIPEYELNQWLEEMGTKINAVLSEKDKAIVNISGASASGKGEATEALAQKLRSEGKKVLVISTDDFYKGISRMITENITDNLTELGINPEDMENLLKRTTGDKEYGDKLSDNGILEIQAAIENTFPDADFQKLIETIKKAFSNLDFDNPGAVDLSKVAQALQDIRQNQPVSLPQFSMKVSEQTDSVPINASDYDVVLTEGIYGLNDDILPESDVKSFIEADRKTLLMRRFRRDVLSGRSSFPPDLTLFIMLEIVLPAYDKYILPDKDNADMVLKNDYTGNETFDTGHYDVQDKIRLARGELSQIEETLGEPRKTALQHDYYFSHCEDDNLEHLIRLRVENGRLKSLVHKGTIVRRDDGKIVRPTEQYIKDGQFTKQYTDEEEVVEAFRKGGFEIVADFTKLRKTFIINGVEITADSIEGLGDFIELRTNDKLSKSPNVDDIVAKLGLSDRKPVGPYADEFIAFKKTDPEISAEQETILNNNLTRETVLENGLCEVIESSDIVQDAFSQIRRGYPDSALSEQCKGTEFRDSAIPILDKIAQTTLATIDREKAVVLLPWRSGIAFAHSFKDQGVNNFYHLSSKRDEETLSTLVDYESGKVDEGSIVIISDPMLATGNTIVDAIERMVDKGVKQENIYVNAVVASPVGVARIKKTFPEVSIIVGSLDDKLDHRGYIVPGLGDFGDKYFAELNIQNLGELTDDLGLDEDGKKKLTARIRKQGVSEVLSDLIQRDMKDLEIDRENRAKLFDEGLKIQPPKKSLKIDTGRIEGIENVVDAILSEVDENTDVLTIEGGGGTGKSSTAHKLAEKLGGTMLSMGEVFRYLTTCALEGETDFGSILGRMHYKIDDGILKLFDNETDLSTLGDGLRSDEIEAKIPEVAAKNQKNVIEFVSGQISHLKEQGGIRILIEGRAFTLDFLPSDLRIKLIADPSVRAERRWNQIFSQEHNK